MFIEFFSQGKINISKLTLTLLFHHSESNLLGVIKSSKILWKMIHSRAFNSSRFIHLFKIWFSTVLQWTIYYSSILFLQIYTQNIFGVQYRREVESLCFKIPSLKKWFLRDKKFSILLWSLKKTFTIFILFFFYSRLETPAVT